MIRVTAALLSLATVLLLPPAGPSAPAHARTVNIHLGSNLSSGRRITCREGQRLISNRGFRDVRRIDCRGRYYVYHATSRRSNDRFEIALRARDGRVEDFRRLGRRRR